MHLSASPHFAAIYLTKSADEHRLCPYYRAFIARIGYGEDLAILSGRMSGGLEQCSQEFQNGVNFMTGSISKFIFLYAALQILSSSAIFAGNPLNKLKLRNWKMQNVPGYLESARFNHTMQLKRLGKFQNIEYGPGFLEGAAKVHGGPTMAGSTKRVMVHPYDPTRVVKFIKGLPSERMSAFRKEVGVLKFWASQGLPTVPIVSGPEMAIKGLIIQERMNPRAILMRDWFEGANSAFRKSGFREVGAHERVAASQSTIYKMYSSVYADTNQMLQRMAQSGWILPKFAALDPAVDLNVGVSPQNPSQFWFFDP